MVKIIYLKTLHRICIPYHNVRMGDYCNHMYAWSLYCSYSWLFRNFTRWDNVTWFSTITTFTTIIYISYLSVTTFTYVVIRLSLCGVFEHSVYFWSKIGNILQTSTLLYLCLCVITYQIRAILFLFLSVIACVCHCGESLNIGLLFRKTGNATRWEVISIVHVAYNFFILHSKYHVIPIVIYLLDIS